MSLVETVNRWFARLATNAVLRWPRVTLANMIPFFDEVARVVAPGGAVVFVFSGGAETPIYVLFERLRSELSARKFWHFAELSAGRGTALLARKLAES